MIRTLTLSFLSCLFALSLPGDLVADDLRSLLGAPSTTQTRNNETLLELALRLGIGYQSIVNANPGLDPWTPASGETVQLPSQSILPADSVRGLTINLAELRLYMVSKQTQEPAVYPLGIGREGWETPEGLFQVTHKKRNPAWRVPASIRREDPSLPRVITTGPDNPLGDYWLGLSAKGYGLHGTNRPLGVGRRISHGCMRFYPEQIRHLYETVPVGTKVRITYQPVKAGIHNNSLYLEVHPDYLERHDDLFQEALRRISHTGWPGEIDYRLVEGVVKAQTGLPVQVGRLAGK